MMRETRPIIALDFATLDAVKNFLALFDETLYVKIGMELFYTAGPRVLEYVKSLGHNVFLDLKLHDIPHTVESTMKVVGKLGVDMTNVHAAGGIGMMRAAREGLLSVDSEAKLIAVSQLTSTSEASMQRDQLIKVSLQESVCHYAQLTAESGLDGVVCSAQEVALIKSATRKDFICLTPGIRPTGSAVGDQKRVMTPSAARAIGSDYIVVGRPITQSKNPVEAYEMIKKEWNGEL
jgi:orotidine-5'-phosphate decarboxylase